MYENVIGCCNMALKINKDDVKTQYRKAKALSYLFHFDESIEIFNSIKG